VSARAPDGIIEAVESKRPGRFLLGVQWHPETLPRARRHGALFRALAAAARRRLR
jgi:putative glutamine amidotransferase